MNSKTYNPKACCNSPCDLEDDETPCWGDVDVIDEQYTQDYSDYWWIHSCEGHWYYYDGGEYKKQS